jgi:hypothetical protein
VNENDLALVLQHALFIKCWGLEVSSNPSAVMMETAQVATQFYIKAKGLANEKCLDDWNHHPCS